MVELIERRKPEVICHLAAQIDVRVSVADNGPGVAPSDRELIFERFYRVPGTETEGTGLGLPIVRSIAAQHRAAVQVKPNPGGAGSVFVVVFPRLPGPEGETLPMPALPRAASYRRHRRVSPAAATLWSRQAALRRASPSAVLCSRRGL